MTGTTHRRSAARRTLALAALGCALTFALAGTALAGPSTVLLHTAGNFGVLAGSGMTNTGVSTIVGDVGSSPTHTEVGFTPCPAADCVSLTGTNHNVADPNDAVTQQAKTDLDTAYNDAFARTGGTAITAPLGGGTTLVSGLYTAATDIFVGGDLTLDAGGDPNAVFIFQAKTGTLITAAGTSGGVPNTRVLLTNGAQACNVFWQVGSSATIDTYTQFVGTVLAAQSITVNTNATLDTGAVLARNGAVTLQANTIKRATCATPAAAGGGTSAGTTTTTTPVGSATTPGSTTTPISSTTKSPTGTAGPASGAVAGTAVLSGPSGPVTGPFTVFVTGRAIQSVTFFVDGKRVSTVRARPGRKRFSLTTNPNKQSRRVHRVTARITYTPASRTKTSTLRFTYRRPLLAPRPPRFAG
jgi:hypothetical protein